MQIHTITKLDVLQAIGKDRIRQLTIETELVLSGKVKQHPTEIGVSDANRKLIQDLLVELEKEGRIQSYGVKMKTYEVIEP